MGKRERKHYNTSFPWMVEEENLFITKTGNEIVTDAGWEKISFETDEFLEPLMFFLRLSRHG
ncbi:hypothetical protein H6G96_35440 [Nostoc sp. FACHB-892]|uniref:hypothetical protein n=1 Tax=Nostoc sp. FACHB-892 TaxID=2692843 RepID=UPI001681C9E3|nr:hypothetical protein [Nostoc sp. FACHB-892]MBD2731449.1 hypothetical protein [Nostoc sp. FACHB-892]